MATTPPRKPRFLSSVPAEQTIETPRFGQKPPNQPIRPLVPEQQPANASKPAPGADETRAMNPVAAPTIGTQTISTTAAQAQANAAAAQSALAAAAPTLALPTPPQAPTIPLELVRSRLAAAIEALRLQSEKLAEQARADVLEVAFQIARRIVEVEVRQSPEPLFALIRQSLQQLSAARKITLRVSPQDIDALRSARGQETTGTLSVAEIELSVDAGLEPGECVIESDLGQIDGRLANRFAELRRQVAEASEGAA